jgi:hypothetical protein
VGWQALSALGKKMAVFLDLLSLSERQKVREQTAEAIFR